MAEDNELVGEATWHEVVIGPPAGPRVRQGELDMAKLLLDNEVWLKTGLIDCTKLLQSISVSSSGVLTSLQEIATSTWEAATGLTVTLANTPIQGDILNVSAHVHAHQTGAAAIATDFCGLSIVSPASPLLPNTTSRYFSVPDASIIPIELNVTQVVGASPSGNTVSIWGRQGGAGKLILRNPYLLRVLHLRPVAAP